MEYMTIWSFYRGGTYGDYRYGLETIMETEDVYCILPKIRVRGLTLTEGVTKTYPTNVLLREIKDKHLFQRYIIKCFNWNGDNTIASHILVKVPTAMDTVDSEKTLVSFFESYGYFLGSLFLRGKKLKRLL